MRIWRDPILQWSKKARFERFVVVFYRLRHSLPKWSAPWGAFQHLGNTYHYLESPEQHLIWPYQTYGTPGLAHRGWREWIAKGTWPHSFDGFKQAEVEANDLYSRNFSGTASILGTSVARPNSASSLTERLQLDLQPWRLHFTTTTITDVLELLQSCCFICILLLSFQ